MSIFNELVNNNSHKLTKRVNSGNQLKAQYIDEGATCSRTIASLRSSRSSAVAHATTATDDFIKLHPDCSKVNGVDAGCIWGDYGCIATQEISCTGGGCSAPFGQL